MTCRTDLANWRIPQISGTCGGDTATTYHANSTVVRRRWLSEQAVLTAVLRQVNDSSATRRSPGIEEVSLPDVSRKKVPIHEPSARREGSGKGGRAKPHRPRLQTAQHSNDA